MPNMDLADHVIKCNLFPFTHKVKRRDELLRALYCIHEGIWFCPAKLIRKTLFRFEEKIHHNRLRKFYNYSLPLPSGEGMVRQIEKTKTKTNQVSLPLF